MRVWVLVALTRLGTACVVDDPGPEPPELGTPAEDVEQMLPNPMRVDVEVRVAGGTAEGAVVLQGGSDTTIPVDAKGRAVLALDTAFDGELWVVAALPGHRSAGVQVREEPLAPIVIDLLPVEIDNADYAFMNPGVGGGETTEHCSHCHVEITEGFGLSQHFEAARDPLVHDVFAGTASGLVGAPVCDEAGGRWLDSTLPGGAPGQRCYLGHGVLPDFAVACGGPGEPACDDPALDSAARPTEFGGCADCHAPAVEGAQGAGHSLLDVRGLAYDSGVHCDFCHKVQDVDLSLPAGRGGRLQMGRPLEVASGVTPFRPVMYGPYADVLNGFMGGAWAPVFTESRFCSGCHELHQEPLGDGTVDLLRWPDGAIPVHTTWSEWAASGLAGVLTCQGCHMPPLDVLNAADLDEGTAVGLASGFPRAPGTVRSHHFQGALDEVGPGTPLVATAAALDVDQRIEGMELIVDATVRNIGAGHALPTGEPMRSVVLHIDAKGCDGETLKHVGGDVIRAEGFALAEGIFGEGLSLVDAADGCVGCALVGVGWPEAAANVDPQHLVVRVVRSTGTFLDYDGVPPFAAGGFAVEDRGLPQWLPIDAVPVAAVLPTALQLARPLVVQAGDRLFLGQDALVHGETYAALAGAPGADFMRVLADAAGQHPVPHHRAVDVVRDTRIPAGSDRRVTARFALPADCTVPSVSAILSYRRHDPALALQRRWPGAVEHQIARVE